MWKITYNLFAHLALPIFIIYGLTRKKIRKNLFERLSATTKKTPFNNALWIHAASVGEAAIAENLIHYMRKNTNMRHFVVTTNTYYTKDMLRVRFGNDIHVFSLPLDLSYLINRFIANSDFKAIVIIETEIWPNLIWQAKKRSIPIFIVNGRISDHTIATYRRFSSFLSSVLNDVEHVAAQSNTHKERFVSIGMNPQKVTSTGNIKYYRMLKEKINITTKGNIVTFGSVKEKELETIFPVITSLKKDFQDAVIYIAPREIHLASVIEQRLSKNFKTLRFSTFKEDAKGKIDIIVVDTIGDLMGNTKKVRLLLLVEALLLMWPEYILEPRLFLHTLLLGLIWTFQRYFPIVFLNAGQAEC
jgi:3-deoxy-D-manno-octulosonic-acid transferase